MGRRILYLIPSVILYLFAGLLAAYAIWGYFYCADIISQARAVGQLPDAGIDYNIASFYMGNCGQYIVFTLLLAAAGLILQRKRPELKQPNAAVNADACFHAGNEFENNQAVELVEDESPDQKTESEDNTEPDLSSNPQTNGEAE